MAVLHVWKVHLCGTCCGVPSQLCLMMTSQHSAQEKLEPPASRGSETSLLLGNQQAQSPAPSFPAGQDLLKPLGQL